SSTQPETRVYYPLALHDALPIFARRFIDERFLATYDEDEGVAQAVARVGRRARLPDLPKTFARLVSAIRRDVSEHSDELFRCAGDRKSTRLNSSHVKISYAVFCL